MPRARFSPLMLAPPLPHTPSNSHFVRRVKLRLAYRLAFVVMYTCHIHTLQFVFLIANVFAGFEFISDSFAPFQSEKHGGSVLRYLQQSFSVIFHRARSTSGLGRAAAVQSQFSFRKQSTQILPTQPCLDSILMTSKSRLPF